MKKVFIIVAFLAGFSLITTSFTFKPPPPTNLIYTYNGSFSMTGRVLEGLCLGEDITLEGDLHFATTIVIKPNGRYHETTHFNSRSITGIGTSGKQYLFQQANTEVYKTSLTNPCLLNFDHVLSMKIITRGANSNYFMKVRMEGFFNECEQLTTVESREIMEECR